jgi:hypothetical protein
MSEEMDLALPNFLTASSPLVFGAALYATGLRGLSSTAHSTTIKGEYPFPLLPRPVLRIHDILVSIRIRGSMPLTYGSGFGSYFQDANKKQICLKRFSAYYFLKVHLHHFSKIKSEKKSQNSWNEGFSHYFCLMIEGPDPYI